MFLFLQSAIAVVYFYAPDFEYYWPCLFILHLFTSLFISLACYLSLPAEYIDEHYQYRYLFFFFIFNFFLPILGPIGSVFAIILALYMPKYTQPVTWDITEAIDLPDTPGEFSMFQYSGGSMTSILLHHYDVYQRQQVVQAAIHLPAKASIPILKIAISDASDDVRLLAFSALEKMETDINKNLVDTQKRFNEKHNHADAITIAEQYWELCYLGIASHAARQLYLKNAQNYLIKAERLKPTTTARLLLGRVLTARGNSIDAIKVFSRCIAMGIHKNQVAPYLAEAAFDSGRYDLMKNYLSHIPDTNSDKFSQIKAYWS